MDNEETVVADPAETTEETTSEEGTGDEADQGTDATNDAPSGDEVRKEDIKGLTDEAQAAVNRRIGKVVAREKAAIARADAAEAELGASKGKLEGGLPELVKRLGLHSDLVDKSEAEVIDRYGKLRAQRNWCRQHEDGYEGAGGNDPSIDAKTVRQRLVQIEDELEDIGGTAKEIQTRADKQAREIWNAGRNALKRQSEKPAARAGKPVVQPPKIPTGTGTPKAPGAAKKMRGGFDAGQFQKDGGGKTALEKQFEKLYG